MALKEEKTYEDTRRQGSKFIVHNIAFAPTSAL